MSIGENIRRIRKKNRMTQKELGEKLGGLSQQQIGQWENGNKKPKIETLQKIANALDVPIYELAEYGAPIPDIGLQANIIVGEKRYMLLLDFIRNMGYTIKFSGCPSKANLWIYDENEKGFWTGDKFITSCQFGENCELCHKKEVTFYELSKNKKSVKVKISTMHGFLTMVEHDVEKILTLIFEHGDI